MIWSSKAPTREFPFEGAARAYRTVARPILPRKLVYAKCRTETKNIYLRKNEAGILKSIQFAGNFYFTWSHIGVNGITWEDLF